MMKSCDENKRKQRPAPNFGLKPVRLILIFCLLLMARCAEYRHENPVEASHAESSRLQGFAQKGPFQKGGIVSYSPLNERLETICTETGEVLDQTGYFELPYYSSVFLHRIEVSGLCYNEVTDRPSACIIRLQAVTSHEAQVNVLTSLAAGRIEALVRKGSSFEEARMTAEHEVLSLFHMADPAIGRFSTLDITQSGNGPAALLAVSAIVLGDGSDAGCRDLLTSLSEDLRDGTVDDSVTMNNLTANARKLDTEKIRKNLTGYYQSLNRPCQVPYFEQYALRLLPFHVVSSDPVPGETGVSIHSVIRIQMNKPFNDLPDAFIQITGPSGIARFVTAQLHEGFLINPEQSLEYESAYTLVIHAGFTAIDSSRLEVPYSVTFTTRRAPGLNDLPDTLMVSEPYSPAAFTISNTGEDTLFWQIEKDVPWMLPEPVQGICLSGPGRVLVTVDTAGLDPGDYYGIIRIHSNVKEDSIKLHLKIPKHPVLRIKTSGSPDLGYHGNGQSVEISNSGTGSLVWSAYSDEAWLILNPSSGIITGDDSMPVGLTVHRDELPGGRYTGRVFIQSDGGSDTIEIFMAVIHHFTIYPDSGSGEDASVCSLPCSIPPEIYSGPCMESDLSDLPLLRLESWTYSGYTGTFRSYIRFELTGLPADALIDSAQLDLIYPGTGETGHEGDNGFVISRVVSSWQAAGLNWNNQPDIASGTAERDRIVVMESLVMNQNYRIQVTEMTRFWQTNPDQNYGMRFSLQTEHFYRRVMIGSSESGNKAYRPKITVFYRPSGE
jgi:hypothetical protein